jgi:hypothetical protein
MRQQIIVSLDTDTGPVFHGASGALYGLSEDGVPGADLVAPLHIRTVSQKPPGGLQHPGGDADRVAPGFFAAGGELVFVLMQDIYPDWPYRDCGIDDYLAKIKSMVASADRRFAFIPFNEPDWIWYDLKTADADRYLANRDRFLADWTVACQAIRSDGGVVVGPNEAYYDARFMPDFLAYAKANDVLPDIISWHELSPASLESYRVSYAGFRALEQRLGISPLPVAVSEYGNRRDLSCPGQLVQWIAMFEETKVYADLAFWDIAGNYCDNAVANTIPNGSWWLLRWYGAMTGHTVRVTPLTPGTIDTLSGLASLDPGKRQARIIVANPAGGAARIALTGIDPGVLGDRVRVLIQAASWTGYDGPALTPLDLTATEYPVTAGQVNVDLDAMDPMTAYQLIVCPASQRAPRAPGGERGKHSPGGIPPRAEGRAPVIGLRREGAERPSDEGEGRGSQRPAASGKTQCARYLAADATLAGCAVNERGSAARPQGYAAAGGTDVGPIGQPGSGVEFRVSVPQAGRYLLRVYYGNQTEDIAQQGMRIDDRPWSLVSYPPTLNGGFGSHLDLFASLGTGSHLITFGAPDPATGAVEGVKGEVTLNALELAYAPTAVPGVTHSATHYPAVYADLSGGAAIAYPPGSGPAGSVTAPGGSRVGFVVQADRDGYHRVSVAGSGGNVRLVVGGTELGGGATRAFGKDCLVWLHAGINRIDWLPAGQTAVIDSLDIIPDAAGDAAWAVTYAAAAAGNVLSGTAAAAGNPHAHGGRHVGWIGHGAGSTLTFTGVSAPWPGAYRVMLSYACNERAGSDNYNVNLVNRGFTVTTSAGTELTRCARNTYSWNQFNTIELTVRLAAGANTITFGNPSGYAPNIDKITVAPALLP